MTKKYYSRKLTEEDLTLDDLIKENIEYDNARQIDLNAKQKSYIKEEYHRAIQFRKSDFFIIPEMLKKGVNQFNLSENEIKLVKHIKRLHVKYEAEYFFMREPLNKTLREISKKYRELNNRASIIRKKLNSCKFDTKIK